MPNAKILSEKQAVVEALAARLQAASAGVIVDYRGITVAEDTQLRRELSQSSVEYSVVKNTLTKFAMDKAGLSGLDHVLNGTTSLATSAADPIAPIRIVSEYSKKLGDRFNIKAAFMDGQVLGAQEIEEIAALPSKTRSMRRSWAPCSPPSPASPSFSARSSRRTAAPSRAAKLPPRKPLPPSERRHLLN